MDTLPDYMKNTTTFEKFKTLLKSTVLPCTCVMWLMTPLLFHVIFSFHLYLRFYVLPELDACFRCKLCWHYNCIVARCIVAWSITMRSIMAQSITVHCIVAKPHCSTSHCSTLHCSALHHSTLQCLIAPHGGTLQHITSQHVHILACAHTSTCTSQYVHIAAHCIASLQYVLNYVAFCIVANRVILHIV